jgi:hypothetical protein
VTTTGGSGTNADTYAHTAGGTATNYNLSFVDGALTITPAPLTVSITSVSKVYDGTTSANGSATIISGSLFGDDSISGGSFAFTDPNVSRDESGNVLSDKTVTVSSITVNDGNSGNNYDVSYVNTTTNTITARLATVAADAKSKTTGQSDPALTYTAESQSDNRGLVTGETLSGALTREAGENTGTYEIQQGTVTDNNNPNYDINYIAADLTIAAAPDPVDPDPVDEKRDTAISQVTHLVDQVSAGQGSPTSSSYVPTAPPAQSPTSGTSTLGGLEFVNVSSQGGNGQPATDSSGGSDDSSSVGEQIDLLPDTGASGIKRVFVIDGGINFSDTDELEEL